MRGLSPFISALLACLAAAAPAASGPSAALRQVAGILDYVGADYAGAVDAAGRILDQAEYDEQLSLLDDAMHVARDAGVAGDDAVLTGLSALVRRIEARAPPVDVRDLCRQVRQSLVQGHGLVLEPSSRPDLQGARELYRSQKCWECHGDDGGADTPKARELDPAPASFLDPARVAAVSPHRAFHAITFGVAGTGMASYDHLSAADRWSLAFLVLALRHESADLRRGEAAFAPARSALAPTSTRLSQLTEEDILEALSGTIPDEAQRHAALAWLRAGAPFDEAVAGGTFALARVRLREGVDAYRDGDVDQARRLFISAYLDGVEPHEAGLRARDRRLVQEIERSSLALREAVGSSLSADEVAERATAIASLLDRAEEGRIGPLASFLGSLAIALREGFEAVLLLAALLGIVRARGVPEHVRMVHAGWISAVVVGLATWIGARHVLTGMGRELAEGVVSLLAAAVLLFVTHWTIGQVTTRQWIGFLARQIGRAGRAGGVAVLLLAFIAVYREAVEVILFYEALLIDAGSARGLVILGAVGGLVGLGGLMLVLRRLGKQLDPARFMLASSIVLAVLALVLLGQGIHALQEAGVLGITSLGSFAVPALGLFATLQTLLAQAVLLLLLGASAWWAWTRARAAGGPEAAA